jgi:hypothetical protein
MTWLVRRLLVPLVVGSILCSALLLFWMVAGSDTGATIRLSDAAFAALLVLPSEAIGLIILLPIALALCSRSVPQAALALLLAIVGSCIGAALAMPISDAPSLQDFALPAACGSISALVWFALNRDVTRR